MPDKLVQALEDDRVVIFCGAGVSRGAGLPDFNGLVRKAYQAMGQALPSKRDRQWNWPDRMLGYLEAISVPGEVRKTVAEILGQSPENLGFHQALLQLAKLNRHNGLRLVTTNFDTYFEIADRSLRLGVNLHSGPVLPIPRDDHNASWRSLVYLHGRLEPPPESGNHHLIMTSADFGRAYLTDGWAARFVGQLFADFSVLFVGYSLNDPVLRYMTDAFAAESAEARRGSTRLPAYIFVSYRGKAPPVGEDWRRRGLEPIFYHHRGNHRLLRETIINWAASRNDWFSSTTTLVTRLAVIEPQKLSPSDVANLLWALFGRPQDNGYGSRILAELGSQSSIEWLQVFVKHEIDLLDAHTNAVRIARLAHRPEPSPPALALHQLVVRPGYAEPTLDANSFNLARWLTSQLSKDAAIDWVAGLAMSGRRPHPRLRDLIRHALQGKDINLSKSQRRFWRLVSSEAPWMDGGQGVAHIWDLPDLIQEPDSYKLVQAELLAAVRPYIRLSPSAWRASLASMFQINNNNEISDTDTHFSQVADAEVELVGGDRIKLVIDVFNGIDNANDLLAEMADELTSLLKLSLDLWSLVDEAGSEDDPSLHHQPSIVPHEQNQHFHHWTILIDLLWRGWSRINERSCKESRYLVGRWHGLQYPTFQRMALAAINESSCWTEVEKLAVLLNGL